MQSAFDSPKNEYYLKFVMQREIFPIVGHSAAHKQVMFGENFSFC